jgi:membrane-associated protease RseP (regulator of RpoE activity)
MFTLIVFLLVISVLIFVHEFGHFIVAKKSGVKVDEFAFGFGPKVFSFQWGETLYSLNWIPLGGAREQARKLISKSKTPSAGPGNVPPSRWISTTRSGSTSPTATLREGKPRFS